MQEKIRTGSEILNSSFYLLSKITSDKTVMSKFCAIFYVFLAINWLYYAGLVNAKVVSNSSLGTEFIIGAVNSFNGNNSNITIFINSEGTNNATIFSNITGNISVPSFNGTKMVVLPGSLIPNQQGGLRILESVL